MTIKHAQVIVLFWIAPKICKMCSRHCHPVTVTVTVTSPLPSTSL